MCRDDGDAGGVGVLQVAMKSNADFVDYFESFISRFDDYDFYATLAMGKVLHELLELRGNDAQRNGT